MNLKEEMAHLPEPDDAPWPDWTRWRRQLWHDAQEHPAETFYTWNIVHHCMLSSALPADRAWEEVRGNLDRYGPAMSRLYPEARMHEGYDRVLVRQVGWLAFWEECTGRRVEDLDRILEVGGGFGAMRLAVHRLGFRGEYGILDFPEMALLQQWFLERHGLGFAPWREGPCDLLIALCSLSEMPPEQRVKAYNEAKPKSCLFEYSPRYGGWDNLTWFGELNKGWEGEWAAVHYTDMTVEAWW